MQEKILILGNSELRYPLLKSVQANGEYINTISRDNAKN